MATIRLGEVEGEDDGDFEDELETVRLNALQVTLSLMASFAQTHNFVSSR